MAPDVRSTGDISSIVGNYYDKVMLERLVAAAVLYPLVEKKRIPKGGGKTINWNRYTNFDIPTTRLTEGEVPTQVYLSGSAVTSTLWQLGNWTALSDVLELTSFSDVVKECVDVFADNAALAVDAQIYQAFLTDSVADSPLATAGSAGALLTYWMYGHNGGVSSYYMSADGLIISAAASVYSNLSAAGADDGHTLDLDKISRVSARLRTNNVKPFEDGYYKLYTHPKCVQYIRRSSEWASWQIYSRPEVMDKGEVGRAHGVKIYESTIPLDVVVRTSAPWAAGISGVWNVMWGKGCIMCTEVGGEQGVKTYVKAPNKYDTTNPLDQWSTVGWKCTFAAKVVNTKCGEAFLTLVG